MSRQLVTYQAQFCDPKAGHIWNCRACSQGEQVTAQLPKGLTDASSEAPSFLVRLGPHRPAFSTSHSSYVSRDVACWRGGVQLELSSDPPHPPGEVQYHLIEFRSGRLPSSGFSGV